MQPSLSWKSSKYNTFWVCVSSLRYPACDAHAPYCHLWPVWLYYIFPHYLINSTIFEKKLLKLNVCFYFLYKFVWNNSHSNKSFATYDHKFILVFMWSTCYSRQILTKLEFLQRIFLKILKYDNPSSGRWALPYSWTDKQTEGHDEANSCFFQFCECA